MLEKTFEPNCDCKRTAYFTLRNGRKIWAKWYKKTCFIMHTSICPYR